MSTRALLTAFFVLLLILHQDFWWKNDATLVLGVLPVSLAYHVVWTLVVAVAWWLVTRFAWPADLDSASPAPPDAPVATPPAAR